MLRKISVVLLLLASCAAQSAKGRPRNSERPDVWLRLPQAHLQRLPNGLQAIAAKSDGVLRTVLQVRVAATSVNDAPGQTGVSEAVAQLLITDDLRRRLEDYGARIEVFAPYGSFVTVFSVSVPSSAAKPAAELFFAAFTHPRFTAEQLARWKKRRAAELESAETSPSYLAESVLDRALYRDGRQWNGPTAQTLEAIDVAAVEDFYRKYYAPCRSWAGVIGPAAAEKSLALLARASSKWTGCPVVPALAFEEAGPDALSVYVVNHPRLQQAYLRLGGLGVYRLSPDYPAVLVLNRILGAGPGGRLWQALRQKRGSTYDVRSSLTALKYLHHFAISATVAPEDVDDSIQTVLQQLELLRANPPSAEEVETARSAILGEFLRTLESSDEILGLIMTQYGYGFPEGYWQSYADDLRRVSPEAVEAAARKYFDPQRLQIVAIGNGQILKSQLQHQGIFHEVQYQASPRN